jgi:hypothetical protein
MLCLCQKLFPRSKGRWLPGAPFADSRLHFHDPSCMTSAHLLARIRAISGTADYRRGSEGDGSDLVHQRS